MHVMQIHFEPNIANQLRALASQSGKSEDFYVQQAVKSFLEDQEDIARAEDILSQKNRTWTQKEVERELGASH